MKLFLRNYAMLLHYFSFATNEPSGLMILVMSFWISTFIDLIAALVFHYMVDVGLLFAFPCDCMDGIICWGIFFPCLGLFLFRHFCINKRSLLETFVLVNSSKEKTYKKILYGLFVWCFVITSIFVKIFIGLSGALYREKM